MCQFDFGGHQSTNLGFLNSETCTLNDYQGQSLTFFLWLLMIMFLQYLKKIAKRKLNAANFLQIYFHPSIYCEIFVSVLDDLVT